MRNFNPLLITLYGGVDDYATVGSQGNCLCFANVNSADPTQHLFTNIHDFSLADPEPTTFAGCLPQTATLLPHDSHMGTERVAVGNKLIARDYSWRFGYVEYDQFQRWRIAQGMPAEGTPEKDNLYAPTILDKWKYQYGSRSCNALLDAFDEGHPALFGSFWHPTEHQSWIDFVKCDFSSTDVLRKNIIRCRTFNPMKVPLYGVKWTGYVENYTMEVRCIPGLTGTEYAECVEQYSNYSDFRVGDYTWERSQYLSAYGSPYQYHTTTWSYFQYRGNYLYIRWKCKVYDTIEGVKTLIRESSWSDSLSLSYVSFNLSSFNVLNATPQFIPYYGNLVSWGKSGGVSTWQAHIQTSDEDINKYRFQVSTDPNFATTYIDTTVTAIFAGNSEDVDWDRYPLRVYSVYGFFLSNIPNGEGPFDNYYCRVRGENSDGSVVGAWSVVYTLTYTPHTEYATSGDIGIYGTSVAETNDTSVSSYAEELSFIVDEDIAIATILEDNDLYLYAIASDGSGFTKTLVPNPHGSTGEANLYNFIRFEGKVYALYSEYWWDDDGSHSKDSWVEITDGVFGTPHEIVYPSSGYKYQAWICLTNIYGHLQLVASLSDNELLTNAWGMPKDNNNRFRLATCAILDGETEVTIHDDIIAGRTHSIDPWNNSIWYEYDGRFEENDLGYRISWLQPKLPILHSFPWVGKFSLSHVI